MILKLLQKENGHEKKNFLIKDHSYTGKGTKANVNNTNSNSFKISFQKPFLVSYSR